MFIVHNFLAILEEVQFKELIESMLIGSIISCELISPSSFYFGSHFIQKNPFLESLGYEPPMIKEVHYYVLDETMNDTLFVEPVFMLHWCHLQGHGCSPKFYFVLSNG